MGIETIIGAVAPAVIGGILGGSGSSQSGTQTATNQNQLDPRIAAAIFGNGRQLKPGVQAIYDPKKTAGYYVDDGGEGVPARWVSTGPTTGVDAMLNPESDFTTDTGLLGRYTGMLDTPQDPAMAQYGQAGQDYLSQYGATDMGRMRDAAGGLLGGTEAPQMRTAGMVTPDPMKAGRMDAATTRSPGAMQAATMDAARINAPGQNGLDLTGSYDRMINGAPGANPYLTGAIQGSINQSSNAFRDMLTGATRNLTESILPSIRSGARVSGSYGGNREALAQGKALESFNTQIGQAATQFGQHNTDAAVGAQAGAYDQDQSRALSAMSGLSGNQYGVAGQQAGFDQQAGLANQGAQMAANSSNFQAAQARAMQDAQMRQQANATNAGFQQQKGATEYGGLLDLNHTNAGLLQQANTANMQSHIATNALDSANAQAGISGLNGLLGNAYATGANQDGYDISQAAKVNGLLAPYLSANSGSTSSQPLYENKGGNILGGAVLGTAIGNQFGGLGGLLGGGNPGAGANGFVDYSKLGNFSPTVTLG